MKKLYSALFTVTYLCSPSLVFSSDFGMLFVNSSSLGVGYADWSTATNDASVSYTNPAALVELPHQQLMVNPLGIVGSTKFTGTSTTPPFPYPAPVVQHGTARGSIKAFAPSFFYSIPITDRVAFGIGVTAPFGLGTEYKRTSMVRYAATTSQVVGIDLDPSLGFKFDDHLSFGAGFDILHLAVKLDNQYGPPLSPAGDSKLRNHVKGWGYGWHAGSLLKISPQTRFGLTYYSIIRAKTNGFSEVDTPFNGWFKQDLQRINAALPARADFSAQHDLNARWTAMATMFYTNWESFDRIVMQNTMTPMGVSVPVTIPFNYHNGFDYSFGTTFRASEKWLFRGGLLILTTPSNNRDRGVGDPVGNANVVTLGFHYQQSEALSYDVGAGHSFFKKMKVNYTNPLTMLKGHSDTQTTVVGAQVNWNIT